MTRRIFLKNLARKPTGFSVRRKPNLVAYPWLDEDFMGFGVGGGGNLGDFR